MPIDLPRAEAAVRGGLSFPCALCDRHWSGCDRGLSHCGVELCGGPLSGRTFPEYRGPLPKGDWPMLCFRCGEDGKDEALELFKVIGGGEKKLAVCKEHRSLLAQATVIFVG